jgi:hypothetical protein
MQALGRVARVPGQVPTAEILGAEAPRWANPRATLLPLELPAARQAVEWREPPRDVAGDVLFSAGDAASWRAGSLDRVRDALHGMRTVAHMCALWAWLHGTRAAELGGSGLHG